MQTDGFGEQAKGESQEQHEGETFAPFGPERQRQPRINESPNQYRYSNEAYDLAQGNDNAEGLEGSPRKYPDHEAKEYQCQQVIDDTTGDNYARNPGLGQIEVLEALERNHHGSGRHRQADEGRADEVHTKQPGQAEADRERHDGTHDSNPHRALQGLVEFERLGLDAGVKHQEKNTDIGQ